MADETPLHIVGLKVENFKRIEAVHIEPDGTVIPIVGKNGSGKTSILDSIEAAFGGKDAFPKSPVRKGAKKGVVEVDLGELALRRVIRPDGAATFELVGKEGENIRSPQAVMDKLYNSLTVDPVKFERMKPAEQRAIVSKLSGVDGDKYKARRETVYNRRTEINRDEKAAAAKVDQLRDRLAKALEEAKLKAAPKEPVNVKDLMAELKKEEDHAAAVIESRRLLREQEIEVKRIERLYAESETAIKELESRIEHERTKLGVLKVDGEKGHAKLKEMGEIVESFRKPDLEPIKLKIANAEGINNAGRTNAELLKAVAEHERLAKESADATAKIEAIDEEYQQALAAAKMPIEGLSFDENGVTYNGVPFEEASSAERLRVSCAIAMSGEHRLRVLLVRDGSLLDTESRKVLREIAEARGYQCWLEIASDRDDEVGVRIDCGRVVDAEDTPSA